MCSKLESLYWDQTIQLEILTLMPLPIDSIKLFRIVPLFFLAYVFNAFCYTIIVHFLYISVGFSFMIFSILSFRDIYRFNFPVVCLQKNISVASSTFYDLSMLLTLLMHIRCLFYTEYSFGKYIDRLWENFD